MPWREDDVDGETFPHIYGALDPHAVVRWRPARLPPFEAAPVVAKVPDPPIVLAFYGLTVVVGTMALTLATMGLIAHAQAHGDRPTLPHSTEFLVWTLAAATGLATVAALAVAWLLHRQTQRSATREPDARAARTRPGVGLGLPATAAARARRRDDRDPPRRRAGRPYDAALRVLETSHPPTYYVPESAFADGVLRPTAGSSYCEWKGSAAYYDLVTPARTAERAGGPTRVRRPASRPWWVTSR